MKQQLIEQLGVKDEGSQSFHVEGNSGQQYKVITKQEKSRLVDAEQARQLSESLPAQIFNDVFIQAIFEARSGYRAIKDTNPDLIKLIDTAVVTRPLSPRCTIEVLEDESLGVMP